MSDTQGLTAAEVRHRAVRGVVAVTARGFAVRLLGFAGTIVVARLLTPHDVGIVAIGFSAITFGYFLSEVGLGAALVRRPEPPSRLELQAMLGLHVVVSVVILVIAFAMAWTWLPADSRVVAVMLLAVPAAGWRVPGTVVLERQIRFGTVAAVELGEIVAYNVWAITTVVLGFGVWGLATASIVRMATASTLTVLLAPLPFLRPSFRFGAIRPILPFALRFQGGTSMNVARDNLLTASVAGIGSVGTLGLWSLAQRVVVPVYVVVDALSRVSYAAMARLLEGSRDSSHVAAAVVKIVAVPVCLALTVIVCATPGGVPVIFGDQWQGAAEIVPWACLGLAVHAPLTVGAISYLYARGDARSVLWSAAANAVFFVGITAGLLSLVGVQAIGVAWAAATAVEAVVLERAVRRHTSTSLFSSLVGPAASAAVAGSIGLWISSVLGNDLEAAVAAAAAGAAVYLVMAYLISKDAMCLGWGLLRSGMRGPAVAADATRS